jgi:hypothetical protein
MTSWDLFIAYASPDREHARALHDELQRRGRTVFLDVHGIAPGADWGKEIVRALEAASVVVVLVSASTQRAQYLRDEIARACRPECANTSWSSRCCLRRSRCPTASVSSRPCRGRARGRWRTPWWGRRRTAARTLSGRRCVRTGCPSGGGGCVPSSCWTSVAATACSWWASGGWARPRCCCGSSGICRRPSGRWRCSMCRGWPRRRRGTSCCASGSGSAWSDACVASMTTASRPLWPSRRYRPPWCGTLQSLVLGPTSAASTTMVQAMSTRQPSASEGTGRRYAMRASMALRRPGTLPSQDAHLPPFNCRLTGSRSGSHRRQNGVGALSG